MKANNYLVTWDDLSTMGLTAKGTPPTGLGISSKAELIAAYFVDQTVSPFSTYSPTRCPRYQDIVPLDVPPLSVWGARESFGARSNNAGVIFTNFPGLSVDDNYRYIGASNDGVYICISVNYGFADDCKLMVSNNSGSTWTSVPHIYTGQSSTEFSFGKVAVSASTGQYMISSFSAVASNGRRIAYLMASSNFGVTWAFPPVAQVVGFYNDNVVSCDISANGNYYIIAGSFEYGGVVNSGVGFTTNFGATWNYGIQQTATWFNDIKISSTAQYQILAASNGNTAEGKIWISSNFGYNWTLKVDDASYAMDYVAMTDDAVYQIGMGRSGKYYVSTNSGATFSITGFLSGGSISSISMTAYNYGSTPYIIAYSLNQAFVYILKSPFTSWNAVPVDSVNWWRTQRRAIPSPYVPELIPLQYTYTLYYDYNDGLPVVIGFTIPEDACSAVNSFPVYSDYSPITILTTLFYDIYGTIQIQAVPSSAPSQNYYKIGSNILQFSNNYTINSITSCPVFAGDVWFGSSSSSACNEGNPQQYLWWGISQSFYNGLVFYIDMALTIPYDNTNGYTYCRSDGSGGGFAEYNLSGNTLGSATGVVC
tara:strand:- start:9 stop:1790 length:1782 start_codon:yes stop_codon:yes gene_type:complete